MPFDASLPDEVAPGEATAFRCKYVSNADGARCERIYDHGGAHMYGPFVKQCGSAHRVPQLVMTDDWVQRCVLPPGHKGQHSSGRYAWDQDPAFVPADAETAGCPPACAEAHTYSGSCLQRAYGPPPASTERLAETAERKCNCDIPDSPCDDCLNGCRRAADELSDEHRESEASKTWPCGDCGANVLFELDDCPECERRRLASRRPPYAVAYALASGELYEVALPGDAVATVEGGVLKISHPQGVAHIIQVKPMRS